MKLRGLRNVIETRLSLLPTRTGLLQPRPSLRPVRPAIAGLGLGFALVAAALGALAPSPAQAEPIRFKRTVIDAKSNFEAAGVADIDKDGAPDIICGDVWRSGPDFVKAHPIIQIAELGGYRVDFANIPMDVDGDGWMDIVSCNWHDTSVVWRRNPGKAGLDAGTPWVQTEVDKPGNMETAIAADIDGDGVLDFLPDVAQNAAWYRLEKGALVKRWISKTIGGHGIGFGDVNGDGRGDILKASGWFEAPADRLNGEWTFHQEWELGGAGISIIPYDFNGDGLIDVFSGNGHDYGTFWMEQTKDADPKKRWVKHQVDKDWSQAHALVLVDLDRDGTPEILTGKRRYAHETDPGAEDPQMICYYVFDKAANAFRRETLHYGDGDGMGLAPAVIDIDGDGDLDFVAPGKSGLYLYQQEKGGGPREPEPARASMVVPEGFEITTFASEPMIRKPISIAFDGTGRMVVAEASMYPLGPPPGEKPTDAVKILEDTDGDGRADRMTVFADGLNIPDAVAVGPAGIYVAEAPNLWLMRDLNSDGRGDGEGEKRAILTGFGTQDSHHNVHGLIWDPSGRLVMSQGCSTTTRFNVEGREWDLKEGDFFRCWPDGTDFGIVFKGFTNSWGYDWDDFGRWVANDNEGPHLIHLVDGGDYGLSLTNRHVGAPGTLPGIERDYGDKRGYLIQAGLTIYSGDAFPKEYNGAVIQGAPGLHKVIRDTLVEQGASFLAFLEPDLMATDDAWSRTIAMTVGPDGAVYVVDWYNEILAHVEHPLNSPKRDKSRGRIYRIAWKGTPGAGAGKNGGPAPTGAKVRVDLDRASTGELVANLRSNNKWLRRSSQRWLAARGPEAAANVAPLATDAAETPRTRLHAIWTLEETRLAEKPGPWRDRIAAILAKTMSDPDAHVRAGAIQTLRRSGLGDAATADKLLALASDANDFVHFEAARALATSPTRPPLESVLGLMNESDWGDPYLGFAFAGALKPYEAELKRRAYTLGARGLNGEGDALLTPLLRMNDRDLDPVWAALLAMPDVKPRVAETALFELQNRDSAELTRAALEALARRPDLPAPVVRPILRRLQAAGAVADPEDAARARAALLALAGSADPGLRREALITGGVLREGALAPIALKAMDDPDASVAEAATLTAGRLSLDAARPKLAAGIAKGTGRARWAALNAMAALPKPETMTAAYLDFLADPDLATDALAALNKSLAGDAAASSAALGEVLNRFSADRVARSARLLAGLRGWVENQPDAELRRKGRETLTAGEGVLRDWKIIGPFPSPETRGHATIYPPETELKADGKYEGAGGAVAWRAVHTDDPGGVVNLTDMKPVDNVVAYGWTTYRAPAAGRATLYCGSDDSIKVWVNGKLVHDNLVDRGLVMDQDQVEIDLVEGDNVVLVKCGQNRGGWNFHARIERAPEQVRSKPDDLETLALFTAGSPARGEAVFHGRIGCARCHSVDGKGGKVGPDLSHVARDNPPSYMVRSVIAPAEKIAEGYGGVTLRVKGGETLEGFILRETDDEVQFVNAEGKTLRLPRRDIAERRSTGASGMPQDLPASLAPREFVDLIAYLNARQ